jgi:CubicO group peptidase (beta-lactamase class C family)
VKTLLALLFCLAIIQESCSQYSAETKKQIEQVEHSLFARVYFEGDSLWTLEERMKHYGVPGLTITVIKDNKIEWVKTYGVTDKETKAPVTAQTLFQAGSISKPVSAYGALKLVLQNKLSLDEDINKYLKSWKLPDNEFTKDKKVALKHLLSHTGGLTVHGFWGYSPDLPVPTLVQVLDGTPPANSPAIRVDKVPEQSFRYSGGGYCIMQQMMIDVENKSFPEVMQTLVLKPLKMTSSTYDQPLKEDKLKFAATGYLPDGTMTVGKRHTYPEMAAAGLWTTSQDLALFAIDIQKTLKGKSKTVLTKEMATKMVTPFVENFIGLGVFINKHKDDIYFSHGGWDEGFCAQLTSHRDNGYGVVIMINANQPDLMTELERSVAKVYHWSNYYRMHKKQTPTELELAQFDGRFKTNYGDVIAFRHDGNRLFGKPLYSGDEVELYKVSDSTFISREMGREVRVRNDDTNGQKFLMIYGADGTVEDKFSKLKEGEITPMEKIVAGNYEGALAEYQTLQKQNPKDPAVDEGQLNRAGYNFLSAGKTKEALNTFRINTVLYPNSSNVYDSYAEACMKNGDFGQAVANYNKSLELNPKNTNAVDKLKEIEKLKSNK